ncbi:AAA family ATPase [Megalodesulfovibrio paquesii]
MKTLVIASQKGGVGKTTLAGHLAVAAELAGHGPVALVDTDPQASLSAWWKERSAETPLLADCRPEALAEHLERLDTAGAALAIVDTPPAISGLISRVIACADLVLIPTRPSPHDLRAIGATVDLVESAGKRLVFAINGAAYRARLTHQTSSALSQHGTVAPVIIHQRQDFAASMIDGRTVQETDPASKSAEEIAQLFTYVLKQLGKGKKK